MKKYYHISSLGLEKGLIFSCDEDFISGVNDIAICLLKFDVKIVCYCLMSNHFHFILYGAEQACREFVNEYKRRCGIRMRNSKMEVNALSNLQLSINEISDAEYLENAIAYVLRNPLAARINIMPYHYMWSSAGIYFKGETPAGGTPVNDLSERKRNRMLRTKLSLPDDYRVNESGMILPESFVDPKLAEAIFRHPSRLMFALAKKVETEVELKFGIADQVSYTDAEMKSLINEYISMEFGVQGISALSNQQKLKLCSMMKRNYNASVKQICRITKLDPEIVNKLV
jgi:REP element-mobilizing transposase RayT